MAGLGKAIAAAVIYIVGFLIFKTVLGALGTAGWSAMAIAMITGVPVIILAVGVASVLIRPSAYKEQEKQLRDKMNE